VTATPAWPIDPVDPYPDLAALAAQAPLHYLEPLGAWLVLSYELAHQVLRGEGWSSNPAASPAVAKRLGLGSGSSHLVGRSVLFADGADHQRLRQALSGLLTPRAVAGFRHRIASVVDAAFGALEPTGAWELMDELAYAVPLGVICELLDTGVELAVSLREETPVMTALLDPLATPTEIEKAEAAAVRLTMDVMALVAERVGQPDDDLLSQVASELETQETLVMALLLLAAGHETTASLIGSAAVVLHDQPGLTDALRKDPGLIPIALEELLRYEPPVQVTARITTARQRLGGVVLEPGTQLFVSLAGANRDAAVYRDPARFDLNRDGPPHLSFGHGPHFCAGAALARAEACEVITRLLTLDPVLESRDLVIKRAASGTFRRFETLLVA